MKYFVELSTYYKEYHTVKLYPIVNGHLTGEDGNTKELYPNLEDESGYVVML